MKTIQAYQTLDNRIFTDKSEAEDHEYEITSRVYTPPKTNLTPRETELYTMLIKTSIQMKEVAEVMGISLRTIKAHCQHIYKKLNVADRVGLIIAYHDNI